VSGKNVKEESPASGDNESNDVPGEGEESGEELGESMDAVYGSEVDGPVTPGGLGVSGQSGPSVSEEELTYTQKKPCYSIKNRHHMPKCRECAEYRPTTSKASESIVCRFSSFRKLLRKCKNVKKNSKVVVEAYGFCDPYKDPTEVG
jgi:hypothetical protein